MLKIDIEINLPAFEREVDDHMACAFQPAVVEALNRAGEVGRDAVRKGLISAFDRLNPFDLLRPRIRRAHETSLPARHRPPLRKGPGKADMVNEPCPSHSG